MTVTVDEQVLFWAFRYACGRQTYAAHDVIGAIRSNLADLSSRALVGSLREVDFAATSSNTYALGGFMIDAPEWLKLRDELQAELERRP